MIDKLMYRECCLCRACADACPVKAIEFVKEYKGFYYPQINTKKCLHCGLCEKTCPALNHNKNETALLALAAYNDVEGVRDISTSGGVFYALSNYILKNGGYVSGAVLTNDFHVKHIVTNDELQISQLCGSKYVQSDMTGVYQEIRALLKEGKKVLFSGCPCQVAALKTYIGNEEQNLYLVEVICHGVPSDKAFQGYLELQKKRFKSEIKDIRFRDKTWGWHRSAVKIVFNNGKSYLNTITSDPFMRSFLSGTVLKESCYSCKYKAGFSGTDLLLGDFWGAEVEMSDWDDNKGLSAVLINSLKGKELIENLKICKKTCQVEQIVKNNRNVYETTKESEIREEFFDYVERYGYPLAIKKYFGENVIHKLKRDIKWILKCVYYKVTGREQPLY